ncbi:MAG: hypothetical protein NQU42_06730 [Methanothrix sp.]|uniref:hypothetical protein n=1 Tax=Methanothrix sp. TaxID=90426 RepID=UPI0025ED3D6B|nr:hypothetical protein [Methanothrix sp.]MCQ8903770.1 hypothetical protein [Methanothrix sp.]
MKAKSSLLPACLTASTGRVGLDILMQQAESQRDVFLSYTYPIFPDKTKEKKLAGALELADGSTTNITHRRVVTARIPIAPKPPHHLL